LKPELERGEPRPSSTEPDSVRARLLDFLSPGIVHCLGNSLFAVQGHGRMLGSHGPDVSRQREAILNGTQRAQRTLDFYRVILGERGRVRGQAGILLRHAGDILKVPLRENGLGFDLRHGARTTPVFVEAWDLYWPVAWAAASLVEQVPVGFDGSLVLDLEGQDQEGVDLRVALDSDSALLPFPVPVGELCAELTRWAGSTGVRVRPVTGGIRLRVRATVAG